jgi:mycothiol S-conjugate amidase
MQKNRCLLVFHAHPDDESSKGAGTMARYAAEGVRVVLVCATRGEEGEILNPRMDRPGIKEKMAELRVAELETACDLLGVERIYHLGYRDSGMPDSEANDDPKSFNRADPDEVMARLVKIIRAERPDVFVCYDESKGYNHPDHVKVHEYGTRAFEDAADADRWADAGAPWQAKKLYYFAPFRRERLQSIHKAALAEGIDSPYQEWLDRWDEYEREEQELTTQVDVADYIEVRSKALLAHATQIDPDGFWFAIPDDLVKRVYPWEDYTLIAAKVGTELPEDDLFAGL